MPRAVQRATAADVPYSMSSGCATTQSTRRKDSSGRAGNVMPAMLPRPQSTAGGTGRGHGRGHERLVHDLRRHERVVHDIRRATGPIEASPRTVVPQWTRAVAPHFGVALDPRIA